MKSVTAMTQNVVAAFDAFQTIQVASVEGSPAMGMLSGKSGLGKSTAGAWLFVRADGILVRCIKADSLGTFLERLARELGLDVRQRRADTINYIIRELSVTGRPLFIDEADYLADKTEVLETIRDIYDLTGVPVMLIGYEALPRKVKRLPQLFNRISQHVEFKPADFSDIKLMSKELIEGAELEDDLLSELLAASKGNFRTITTGLGNIEKFAKSNNLKSVSSTQWADQKFFPTAGL